MDAMQAILTRKSVRHFTDERVQEEHIEQILHAGTRAPSGKANEPWRFAVVESKEVIEQMATLSEYGDVLRAAPLLVCLFLDKGAAYDAVKDANTMGACAQNMLLAAHALGLGAVWVAEIRARKDEVAALCGVDGLAYELMLVMAIGHSTESDKPRKRKHTAQECIIARK